jgi:hypothetical protein
MVDEDKAIAVTKQGEFYFIDFEKQGDDDGILDPEIVALGLSEDEEDNFAKEITGINFMGLRESDDATEIYPGFRQIIISEC